jgi:hypothetical protein
LRQGVADDLAVDDAGEVGPHPLGRDVAANVSLIAIDPADYPRLERHVTPERVRAHFAGIVPRA